MKKLFLILTLLLTAFSAQAKNPKNVILLIADGAGLSQISYGMLNYPQSNFGRFKNIGLVKTASADAAITDSAASATAFATGKKTYNGAIGLDAQGRETFSILEIAKQKGLATGVVVTSAITHATPAAFLAHQKMREMQSEIADDISKGKTDVLIGGGAQFFTAAQLELMRKKGYKIYKDAQDLFNDKYNGKILGLLANDRLAKISEGRGDYSQNALKKALEVLSKNKKGFVLMFEGSQIDWGGHNNDVQYIKEEMIDFDKAVGVALDFAAKHHDTLVISISDHETGGFALTGSAVYSKEDYGDITPKFTSTGHSATMIPLFAYGEGAQNFGGVYENNEVFTKICAALKLDCDK